MDDNSIRRANYTSSDGDGISLWSGFRMVTGIIGLGMTLFGAIGCIRFFFVVVEFIQKPHGHESLLKEWQTLLQLDGFAVPVAGLLMPAGAAVSMFFLTLAAYLALRILIAIMKSGLTLMSWAKAERALAKQQDNGPIPIPVNPRSGS